MKTLVTYDLRKIRVAVMVITLLLMLITASPCLAESTSAATDSINQQIQTESGFPNTIIDKNGEEISTEPDPALVAANQTPIKPDKWGWLIGIYLFLGGMGAGAYLVSFLAEKGIFAKNGALVKAGYYIGAPAVAIGALLLVFDLGQGLHKPWLILRMFLNLSSVMTWGIYILSLFIVIGLMKAFLAWRKIKSPSVISWLGAILAVCTMAYTGLLLYAAKAIPFWVNPLLPILFVVSALSTGLSAALLLSHILEKRKGRAKPKSKSVKNAMPVAATVTESATALVAEAAILAEGTLQEPEPQTKPQTKPQTQPQPKKMTITHLVLVVLEAVLFLAFIMPAFNGTKGVAASLSANEIVSGSLALYFWLLFVGIGLVLPGIIYTIKLIKKPRAGSSAAGKVMDLLCDGAVLIGGLTLRCLVVFAAYPIWNGLLR
ncbi:polysulfide reductase NrfD [Dehalobacter sp. DCM]|uniref:NrfD/PsrC family molybdoenzyme membrane anchor subunit n=1 Tax=Dehalobacter sp. DCM TaxID=2907827 RepID=UPI003081B939|nr:polysulfide reductase NrfD [Dehalobacter sp. DCM]